MSIEKRRIQKEEGGKAQKALQSLELSKDNGVEVKSSDVDYLVSDHSLYHMLLHCFLYQRE